ncbi:hypothetical protein ACFU96_44265 [Streptomyces sp. NPDC057620]|uniref:hypothetical protein n=1 Tax=Streptomyces sp. NPDC057620 TaxID=3346185 RepID=UPI0036CF25C4
MNTEGHAFDWTHPPYTEDAPVLGSQLLAIAQKAVEQLGDQWSAAAGPGGRTGHLRNAYGDVFTIGVCEAGDVFLRNDVAGSVRHLPHVDPYSDLDEIANAIVLHVGDMY